MYVACSECRIFLIECHQYQNPDVIVPYEGDEKLSIISFDVSYSESLLLLYFSNEEIIVYNLSKKKILHKFKSIA